MVGHLGGIAKERLILSFAPDTWYYRALKRFGGPPPPPAAGQGCSGLSADARRRRARRRALPGPVQDDARLLAHRGGRPQGERDDPRFPETGRRPQVGEQPGAVMPHALYTPACCHSWT